MTLFFPKIPLFTSRLELRRVKGPSAPGIYEYNKKTRNPWIIVDNPSDPTGNAKWYGGGHFNFIRATEIGEVVQEGERFFFLSNQDLANHKQQQPNKSSS